MPENVSNVEAWQGYFSFSHGWETVVFRTGKYSCEYAHVLGKEVF